MIFCENFVKIEKIYLKGRVYGLSDITKLVLKTVAITMASVIGACLVVFGALTLFTPATLARFFDGMGMEKSAVSFYEKQYNKTGDVNDLSVLVMKIDGKNDSARAEKYLAVLVLHDDFESYCAFQDSAQNASLSTKEYYSGQYAVILCRNAKVSEALNFAKNFVTENGYTTFNPYSVMLTEVGASLGQDNLGKIRADISALELSNEQAADRDGDIAVIDGLLNQN